jgi:hypothetical protein
VLDVAVTKIGLQRSRIVALVGQRKAAGVPKHVRVNLQGEPGSLASALQHAGKPRRDLRLIREFRFSQFWFGKQLETREIYEGRLSDLSQLLASRLGRFMNVPLP